MPIRPAVFGWDLNVKLQLLPATNITISSKRLPVCMSLLTTVIHNLSSIIILTLIYGARLWNVLFANIQKCCCIGMLSLDVHGSVHHNTNCIEITNKMWPCSRIFIPMFLNCSTFFGRHTAHHLELKNCNCSLWFYIRFRLPAAAMAQPSQRQPATKIRM